MTGCFAAKQPAIAKVEAALSFQGAGESITVLHKCEKDGTKKRSHRITMKSSGRPFKQREEPRFCNGFKNGIRDVILRELKRNIIWKERKNALNRNIRRTGGMMRIMISYFYIYYYNIINI